MTALETQHAQLEQVNEIIQEQNEMITQLRDLYRVEIAKQINEVAQMKQYHQQQAKQKEMKMNDGMSRALKKHTGEMGEKRGASPGEGPNAKKGGKSEFVVESLALENQVSSEQNVLGRLGQEAV